MELNGGPSTSKRLAVCTALFVPYRRGFGDEARVLLLCRPHQTMVGACR